MSNTQKTTKETAPKTRPRHTQAQAVISLELRNLTRIGTLARQLSADLNYASAPSTQRYWNSYQKRRSQRSISRKKAECLQLIASLPEPFAEQLYSVTKAADQGGSCLVHRTSEP